MHVYYVYICVYYVFVCIYVYVYMCVCECACVCIFMCMCVLCVCLCVYWIGESGGIAKSLRDTHASFSGLILCSVSVSGTLTLWEIPQ